MSRFCSSCGAQVQEDFSNCPYCGNNLNNGQSNFQQNGQYNQQNVQHNQGDFRSRMVAGLLGVFLGAYGIHNFYLGYNSKAVTQIIVTFITCGIGGLWGFIEGILILCGNINTDSDGRPLQQ